jgi:2-polyprenyl-3-methyl-5-hydroxy-6-metoxy-1,4-benzoquinol methylase
VEPVPRCNLCDRPESPGPASETARVRSNVRAFRNEWFTVWRCGGCGSLHARDALDLAPYYADYPFRRQRLDASVRLVYRGLWRRLRRAGFERRHRILDYGCGSGCLVEYLRARGHRHVSGYDAYSGFGGTPDVLGTRYDAIVAQDVVEHVEDPRALLEELGKLAAPGGLIAVGTPDAGAVDLRRADRFVHQLHQPYHRHLFSKRALLAAGETLGWRVERLYRSHYTNTRVPLVNMRFGLHYARCFDDTVDLAFDPVRLSPRLLTPRAIGLALFGGLRPPPSDLLVVFRRP